MPLKWFFRKKSRKEEQVGYSDEYLTTQQIPYPPQYYYPPQGYYVPTQQYTIQEQGQIYYTPTVPIEQQYYQYYEYANRACTGIETLDRLLHGGFRRGEIYLIAGEAGMGKTIFAIQFLKAGADHGEVGIYITVDEPSEDVKKGVRESIGWDLERYENDGKLIFLDFRTHFRLYSKEGTTTIDPRELAKMIIDYIKKYDAKRLVIDPIAPLIITSHHDILWIREYLRELVFQLKKLKDITTVLTSEIPTGEEKKISRFGVEEYLASGVIVLTLEEIEGKLLRVMFIRKMRWTPIEPTKLVFNIRTHQGIVVEGRLEDYIRALRQGLAK